MNSICTSVRATTAIAIAIVVGIIYIIIHAIIIMRVLIIAHIANIIVVMLCCAQKVATIKAHARKLEKSKMGVNEVSK